MADLICINFETLLFVDTAMHRGSDRTACEVTIFRSREMCYGSLLELTPSIFLFGFNEVNRI